MEAIPSQSVFEDDYAITIKDDESDSGEPRFVSVGMGVKGRVLVVVYCYRDSNIRIISARCGGAGTKAIRGGPMKDKYDFSKGTRGRIAAAEMETRPKTRITIRLDEDLVDHFLKEAEASGGAVGYQTLINEALRQHVEGKAPKLEETLRRIVREEMRRAS